MNYWLLASLSVFFTSCLLTGIIIPQILLIAFRKRLFDDVNERKIHKGVVPRLGGIAFMPAIFFSVCAIIGFNTLSPAIDTSEFDQNITALAFGSCAMMLMFLVGMADDLIGVKYRAKFLMQTLSAIFLALGGICLYNMHGFLTIYQMPDVAAWLLTLLVVVFITNAFNLIDGIDGLASGLSAVAVFFYGITFYVTGYYPFAIIAFATLGALVPFFWYNVFGDPARQKKIFMGDTGALTIGLIVSVLSIKISCADIGQDYHINPLVVAFSPLILPCFDVLRVYFHRLRKHRNPFLPDKCHIHHKILALGIPQRPTMILILIISSLFVVANMLLSPYVDVSLLVLLNLVVYMLANAALTKAIRKREHKLHKSLYQ